MAKGDSVRRRLHWPLVLPVLLLMSLIALTWTENSTDLTPGHDGAIFAVALVAGFAGAIAAVAVVLKLKLQLRRPRWVSLCAVAILAGLMVGLASLFTADRLLQLVEFHGVVARFSRELPIDRAYIARTKGVSYHVQTAEPFTDFQVPPADYSAAFGDGAELRPNGYCLQAPIEQKGPAMRIMYPGSRPIPSGRLHRCSAAPP
jgi:hypothetical protein